MIGLVNVAFWLQRRWFISAGTCPDRRSRGEKFVVGPSGPSVSARPPDASHDANTNGHTLSITSAMPVLLPARSTMPKLPL